MESLNPIYLLGHRASPARRGLFVLCLLTATCAACSSQSPSRKQELKLRIVYDYQVDAGSVNIYTRWRDVYTIDACGTDVKRLTSDHVSHSPLWSPDGKQIAFLQDQQATPANDSVGLKGSLLTPNSPYYKLATPSDLIVMPLNGAGTRKIATVGPDVSDLEWLPNAQWISVRSSGRLNPKVCEAHGEKLDAKCDRLETLEETSEEEQRAGKDWRTDLFEHEYYPAVDNFLPTVYMHWGHLGMMSGKEIESVGPNLPFIADLDASLDLKSLNGVSAKPPVAANDAAWSPEGKRIAYSAFRDGHNSTLYIADLKDNHTGSGRALTEPAFEAHSPVWSADGSRLAFTGLWKGTQQIFAINADGTGLTQVSRKDGRSCSHPSWSPDGTLIVAECHGEIIDFGSRYMEAAPANALPSLYTDVSGWGSSIYLFDMSRLGAPPRVLVQCSPLPYFGELHGRDTRNCGAHNPSFAPVEATQ
jgi:Tol biopolymer transport system component